MGGIDHVFNNQLCCLSFMRRKFLVLFVTVLLIGTVWMLHALNEKISGKKLAAKNVKTLSNLPLFDLDSTHYYPKPDRKIILIYFDSSCDYCQAEINDLSINLDSLNKMDIVFMSSELISAIKLYARKNSRLQLPTIRFVKINMDDADRTFGSLAIPQIFIYDTGGNLLKKFSGETKIAALLQFL
jgi:thioredoxin-related protein